MLLAGALGLSACGDTNVFEGMSDSSGRRAELEQGLDALDSGDYDKAIEIFSQMDPNDPDVQKYLSSAYMLKAGFDTLELVNLIAEAQQGNADTSVLYDSVIRIFDVDGDGRVSSAEVADKRDLVKMARDVLDPEAVTDPDAQEDLTFQKGVYAAVDTVVLIADLLDMEDITQESVAAKPRSELDQAVEQDEFDQVATDLVGNLAAVDEAVRVVQGAQDQQNDVGTDFDRFLEEIGYADDQQITRDELVDYLFGL